MAQHATRLRDPYRRHGPYRRSPGRVLALVSRLWPILALALVLVSLSGHGADSPSPDPGFAIGWPAQCRLNVDCIIQEQMDVTHGQGTPTDPFGGHLTYKGAIGTDIRISPDQFAKGVPVLSVSPGIVVAVRNSIPDDGTQAFIQRTHGDMAESAGNVVFVDAGNGYLFIYGHLKLNTLRVKRGDIVKTGMQLADIGMSGLADFPHIDLAILYNHKPVDPWRIPRSTWPAMLGMKTIGPLASEAEKPVIGASGWTDHAMTPQQLADVNKKAPPPPHTSGPETIHYVEIVGSRTGDVEDYSLTRPDGALAARQQLRIDSDTAQRVRQMGEKHSPQVGYKASYKLFRNGQLLIDQTWTLH